MNSTDIFHKITNWIDHNRGQFFGVLAPVIIVCIFACAGCSRTTSLKDPTIKVDRGSFVIECIEEQSALESESIQLKAELEKHNSRVATLNERKQVGIEDLDKQDQIKAEILEVSGGVLAQVATGGSVSTGSLIMTGLNLAGIGWGIGNKVDNTRKDKIITENKETV